MFRKRWSRGCRSFPSLVRPQWRRAGRLRHQELPRRRSAATTTLWTSPPSLPSLPASPWTTCSPPHTKAEAEPEKATAPANWPALPFFPEPTLRPTSHLTSWCPPRPRASPSSSATSRPTRRTTTARASSFSPHQGLLLNWENNLLVSIWPWMPHRQWLWKPWLPPPARPATSPSLPTGL